MKDERYSPTVSNVPLDEIWTTDEVAAYLKISDEKVRIDAKKGLIPGAFQLGNLWRFRSDEVRDIGKADQRERSR